jgi:hypothetical protein
MAAAALVGSTRGLSAEPVPVEDPPPVLESSANTAPSAPVLDASGAVAGSARFVALSPTRILDSRAGQGMPGGVARKLNGWETIGLQVAGVAGVPSGATGVVLNLTVTGNDGPSYVTAWPSQQGQPETSVINLEYANQTIANLVTVPVGVDGRVALFTVASSHLIADVAGYYVGASSATSGRFTPLAATRVLDTRTPNAFHSGPLGAGGTAHVDLNAAAGIPADALAAVVNLTVTNTAGGGFFSAVPAYTDPTGSSNLNVEVAGQTIANQAVVQLNGGWLDVYSSTGGDVVVDVVGWYTGASAASASTGLFVPVAPTRLLDTRAPGAPRYPARPQTNVPVDVAAASRGGLPASGFAALVLNLTATNAEGYGYVTAWGAGLSKPWTSNLNVVRVDQTIANHAVVGVSNLGYSLEVQGGAHLLTDVSGYFTGTPPTADPGYKLNGTGSPPSAGSHGFLYGFGDGSYARWNPCKALTYKVNYVGAPWFARSEVEAAVARVESATGIDLVDMGDLGGAAGNDGKAGPFGVDAVIAFVNSGENPGIGSAAGLGGGGYMPAWNGYAARVVSGFVLINESLGYSQGLGPSGLQGLLLHELGHMMGLDHVQDLAEVMYPVMHNVPNGYGPGDREGLWYLGAAQGCANMAGATPFAPQSAPGDGGGAAGADDAGGEPGVLTAVREGGDQPDALVSYCSLGQDANLTGQLLADTRTRVASVATMASPA